MILSFAHYILTGPKLAHRRSDHWPAIRAAHLLKFPTCAACGGTTSLAVHHEFPFHLYPERELDLRYLITLCEAPSRLCHFIFGHCGLSWSAWNPDVVIETADHLKKVEKARKLLENLRAA